MSKIEELRADLVNARKARNQELRIVLADILGSIETASKQGKAGEITDALVDQVLLKEQKMAEEMVASCPADRAELLKGYKFRLGVIKTYAPKLAATEKEIAELISNSGFEITKANRGKIMGFLKGKADMKRANKVLQEML